METRTNLAVSGRQSISAFIVCCNEERNIRRCLDSVKWCDEIVVIDSGSTDATLAIAKEYTTAIYHREWSGFVRQKRFGLEQSHGDWVLNLDADEEVSPELRDEILHVLTQTETNGIDGYEFLRVVFYMNRWWRKGGWYPEFRLRMVRRSHAAWGGEDPHEKAIVSGPIVRLKHELRHYTYTSIADQIRALNSHSTVAAQSMFERGKRFSAWACFVRPGHRFLKFYLFKRGFLEGLPGLLVAAVESFYVFLKYIKLWELERSSKS